MGKQLKDKNGNAIYPIIHITDILTESNQPITPTEVSVSNTGTSEDKVKYITINGVEKKLAGEQADWNATSGDSQILNKPTTVSSFTNDSNYQNDTEVATAISTHNSADDAHSDIRTSISTIEGKIPTQATSSNQLADKAFVNSSINSVTAYYITKNADGDPFNTKAELSATTVFYSGGEVRLPTRNDYCIVLADESKTTTAGLNPTTRYSYQNGWEFQYIVNQTTLTAAQLAAMNSGITSGKVSTYEVHISNTSNPHSVTKAQVGLGNVDNTSDLNKPISTATQTALNGKQNTLTQGTNITISGNTISATDTTYSAATSSAAGLMSAADKTKLDGIATGATANTGTVTSVAVKMNGNTKGTVTTSGTIDLGTIITSHQDISGKVNLSGGTMSGTLIVESPIVGYNYTKNGSNVAAFVLDKPGSNFTGIGAHTTADTIWFGACSKGGEWVDSYAQTWAFNGTVKATNFSSTSDLRLKENIIDHIYTNSILDLPLKEFDYKQTKIHTVGCIAQDLQKICPELVNTDENGYLSINESKIVYPLIQEVKALKLEVESLKQQLLEITNK